MDARSRSHLETLKTKLDAPPPPPTQAEVEAELMQEFHRLMDASPDGRIPKHILKDLQRREEAAQSRPKGDRPEDRYTEFRKLLLEED
jgi:hypothetical protein